MRERPVPRVVTIPCLIVMICVATSGCATWGDALEDGPAPVPVAEWSPYPGLDAKPKTVPTTAAATRPQNPVKLVRFDEPRIAPAQKDAPKANTPHATLPLPQPAPVESSPIDLPTALRLAGASNLQIALANERLQQAEARLAGANALWLPSINLGTSYNAHSGRIQDVAGRIIETDRSSVFVGGGPILGGGSLNGGAVGPPRLSLGLPLAEAVFTRLAERQQVEASRAGAVATFNDTLLQVGNSYLDLVASHQQLGIARDALANAKELDRLVESRVKAGTNNPADGLRAKAEVADRERQLARAEEDLRVSSAELVRLVRLDPAILLVPAETQPTPIELISVETSLTSLIEQGLTNRPELAQNQAMVQASLERLRQEQWRPWIPSVAIGYSGGGFGGGVGSEFGQFGGRSDFDAVLGWEFRNLGFGNRAIQRERSSLLTQANLTADQTRDNIAAEIVRAYHQVRSRREQEAAARRQLTAAAQALPLNLKGIVGGDLRAIEGQQAVQALAAAQTQYLNSVIGFNQAQLYLLRAIGRPLDANHKPATSPDQGQSRPAMP